MAKEKYTPTAAIAKNAAKGLKMREEFGHGGIQVGVVRANQLSSRTPVSYDIIKRMVSYFARHEVDKNADNFGNEKSPSKGYIAWLLWGGDEAREWALDIKEKFENNE